jgi:hypothetical protein
MDEGSAEGAFFMSDGVNPDVAGTVVWVGNVMNFTPDADLEEETTYTCTVDTGAQDLAGNPIASDYVWSFTTQPDTTLVMHVHDIAMSIKKAGKNYNAIATVLVTDHSGITPVEGATVSGHWSGLTNDTDSGITDESGTVPLKSDKVKNANGTFTFTVDNIIKDGWTYDQSANVENSDRIDVP